MRGRVIRCGVAALVAVALLCSVPAAVVLTARPAAAATADVEQSVDDLVTSGGAAFAYDGTWGVASGISDAFEGSIHYSRIGSSTATFVFTGTRVQIVGVKDVDQGIATYSLDGGPAVQVDHFAPTRRPGTTLFDSGPIPAGRHTVVVTRTAGRNPASSGAIIALDRVRFVGPTQPKTIDVDLGADTGPFMGGAAGSLYGVYGEGLPGRSLLEGIRLRTVSTKAQDGPQHPGADALEVLRPLVDASGGDVLIYMTDIYRGFPYQWPSPDRPGASPQEKLDDYLAKIGTQVDQVRSLPKRYRDHVVFVPFNEPEGNMFGTGAWSYNRVSWLDAPKDFFDAWDRAYRLIRSKLPSARIAGPNTSILYPQVRGFLQHALGAGTMPDVITWHELSSPAEIRTNVNRFRAWETEVYAGTELNGRHLPINLNEYAFNYHTSVPGQMIQWFSAIEDVKVDGDIAYWNIDGNLNDSAVGAQRGNGQWWLLNAYSQLTGRTVTVTPPSPNASYTLQGVATLDRPRRLANLVMGGDAGPVQARFRNLDPAVFGDSVHVSVTEIGWTGQLGDSHQPRPIAELNLTPAKDRSMSIGFDGALLPMLDASSAYQVRLTPGRPEAGPLPAVDPVRWRQSYEAEAATLTGAGITRNGPEGSPSRVSGFYTSGGYNVGGLRTGADARITFSVTVPADGEYDLAVFANSLNTYPAVQGQGPTNVFLSVDGAAEQEVLLPLGYKWVVWGHADTTVRLTEGTHAITLASRSLDGVRATRGDAIVDKIDLTLASPTATTSNYEAENATLNGATTDYSIPAVSGSGVARVAAGQSMDFWVYSAVDGESTVNVDTAGGGAGVVLVNGFEAGPVTDSSSHRVFLTGGVNKITVQGGTGSLAVDRVRVRRSTGALASTVHPAESATLTGSAAVRPLSLAHGGAVVSGVGGAPGNRNAVTFSVEAARAGLHAVTVRYSNGEQAPASHYNPDPLARHALVTVNGEQPQRVWFPNTFHDNSFEELSFPVQLAAGVNAVTFTAAELPSFDGVTYLSDTYPDLLLRSREAPNLDEIRVTPMGVTAGTP